jgi:hypothetical protein
MNFKLSELTVLGWLLLVPTLAVVAATAYELTCYGTPLLDQANKEVPGPDFLTGRMHGVLFLIFMIIVVLGALTSGVIFFVLAIGLFHLCGLRVIKRQAPTGPSPTLGSGQGGDGDERSNHS